MDPSLLPREATQTSEQTLSDLHFYHPPEEHANAPSAANPFATVADMPAEVEVTGVSFGIAKGATNHSTITLTLTRDGHGVAFPLLLMVWLSDRADGYGLTATRPTGFDATTGAEFYDIAQVPEAMVVQCTPAGTIVLDLASTGKVGYYVGAHVLGGDQPYVSRQLTAGDYG